MDLTRPEVAREMRLALRDGLQAQSPAFLDTLLITLVVKDGCDADILERLMIEALRECPQDVQDFWDSPCPCGQTECSIKLAP